MTNYSLTTKKTWHQTIQELEEEMRLWGITEWDVNYPRGARLEGHNQTLVDRMVRLSYIKNGKPVELIMDKQDRAVDNLRVLYLAIQSIRLDDFNLSQRYK